MITIDKERLVERFMRYVQLDTQSDPQGENSPTTEKQKDLGRVLSAELQAMGITDAELDAYGYVYATIPGNSPKKNIPTICFCSHVDTAPDCSGANVKPILHKKIDGSDIVLPDDHSQVLKAGDYPYLKTHVGSDIITASGTTLLGADDKSGVAVIMEAANYLLENPGIQHGDIRLLFTPDEEVGKGTAQLNMARLNAQFGYTMDGGDAGSLEDETFSADSSKIVVHGVIAHPGYAKGKMVNAIKIAGNIVDALPKDQWAPEATEKKEGFVHPVRIEGIAEKSTIEFIVRDFETGRLQVHEERLKRIAQDVIDQYPGARMEFTVAEQYRNMKQVLDKNPQVVAYAAEAIERAGLVVRTESIRGGTDGSKLSYMGLPCPNIFTGMQAIHSKLEWIGVRDMVKSAETIVHLCMIWEEKAGI
ncbi:MAG: peptidase T [Ginsengibacter sp.]